MEKEKRVSDSQNQLLLTVKTLATLSGKVAEEALHIGQFFDSKRRSDLFYKGRSSLRSASVPVITNIKIIEQKMEPTISWAQQSNGPKFCFYPAIPLLATIFPVGTQMRYVSPQIAARDQHQPSAENIKVRISSTTKERSWQDNLLYPSEGLQETTGVAWPFKNRSAESRLQHGGILANTEPGDVDILDYSHLQGARSKPFAPAQILIEANWYMDSLNQAKVCTRGNLQERRPYNSLGIIKHTPDPHRYFVVSSYVNIDSELYPTIGMDSDREDMISPSLSEIAALCNLIAKNMHATVWAVAGLEYSGGGIYFTDPDYIKPQDHFEVYY